MREPPDSPGDTKGQDVTGNSYGERIGLYECEIHQWVEKLNQDGVLVAVGCYNCGAWLVEPGGEESEEPFSHEGMRY